jgi:hypothetical protein
MEARGGVKKFGREIEFGAQNPVEKSHANQDRSVIPNLISDVHSLGGMAVIMQDTRIYLASRKGVPIS